MCLLINVGCCYCLIEGNMYPSVCVASWKGMKFEFQAGSKATIMVLLKDAFGNGISKTTQVSYLPDFKLSMLSENGSVASQPDISNMGWDEFDFIVIEFVVTKAGNFSLRIEGGNQTLNGSPLPLKVNPGSLLFASIDSTQIALTHLTSPCCQSQIMGNSDMFTFHCTIVPI